MHGLLDRLVRGVVRRGGGRRSDWRIARRCRILAVLALLALFALGVFALGAVTLGAVTFVLGITIAVLLVIAISGTILPDVAGLLAIAGLLAVVASTAAFGLAGTGLGTASLGAPYLKYSSSRVCCW